jgi:hypothetical protein
MSKLQDLQDHVLYLVKNAPVGEVATDYLGALDYVLDCITVDDRGEYVMPLFDPNTVIEILGGDDE